MNSTGQAVRLGWRRGMIELRQSFTNGADLTSHFLWPILMLIVLFFMRDRSFESSGFLLGALLLPSILGMNAAMSMMTMSAQLTADREDGTLLRAKATPNGMPSYLIGKIVSVAVGLIADLAIFLIPAMLMVSGLAVGGARNWALLMGFLVLGIMAALPIGAILGSVFSDARTQGLLTLPVLGMIAISGIFYPIAVLPGWVQGIAQVFPVYWLGLGMRSALLPGNAVTVEIGHSWRHWETVGVLGAWAVVGFVVAPIVLSRMARRESGSSVTERKEKALQRVA